MKSFLDNLVGTYITVEIVGPLVALVVIGGTWLLYKGIVIGLLALADGLELLQHMLS